MKEELGARVAARKKRPPLLKQFQLIAQHLFAQAKKMYRQDQFYVLVSGFFFCCGVLLLFPTDLKYFRRYLMQLLALGGVALSGYLTLVESNLSMGPTSLSGYSPLCDLEYSSCSAVLTSEQSRILSFWGLVKKDHILDLNLGEAGLILFSIYFVYMILPLNFEAREKILCTMTTISVSFSIYLIKVMYLDLGHLCLACCLAHTLNILFCLLSWAEWYTPQRRVWKKVKTE